MCGHVWACEVHVWACVGMCGHVWACVACVQVGGGGVTKGWCEGLE